MYCTYAVMSESYVMPCGNDLFTFFKSAYYV